MDNSQAGSINETYDLFLRHGLHLVGETVVRVDHCLLALPGSALDELDEVMSHPQAIAQSEEFLSALDVTVRAEYNTAGAAKRIADQKLERTAATRTTRFVASVSAKTSAVEGGDAELVVDVGGLHFFDPETGDAMYGERTAEVRVSTL